MDEDLYDEFGNYIGPVLDQEVTETVVESVDNHGSEDEWMDELKPRDQMEAQDMVAIRGDRENLRTQIVLHEDKQLYPSAEEVYGADVETLVQDEDTQALDVPIIAPVKSKKFSITEDKVLDTRYEKEFLVDMMDCPEFIRNVALVGHLHHGKTSFMDMVVRDTHLFSDDASKELRYTDTTIVELQRGISIKATPMSVILQDLREKSHLLNIIDCPGHVDFLDEVAAAMRLVDGVVIVVDVVEGVMMQTEHAIKMAVQQSLPITVILNKMDRLILDLRLPPADAYHKLRQTLEEINALVRQYGGHTRLSPEQGNVCFASTLHGYCFSLLSFAKLYARMHSVENMDVDAFAQHLWGDHYLHPDTRQFVSSAPAKHIKRTFIEFILEPIYKIYAHVVGEEGDALKTFLAELHIWLKPAQYGWDVKPLLKLVMTTFLGSLGGWTEMIKRHCPSPLAGAARLAQFFGGDRPTPHTQGLLACDPTSPHLLIHVAKLTMEGTHCDALARILSGTCTVDQTVRILGESYMEDDEDVATRAIAALLLPEARYRIHVTRAAAGNLVYLRGVDANIAKTATLVAMADEVPVSGIFRPLALPYVSAVRLGIEPLQPSELPKMLEGLRKASKTYVALQTRVEESGEHVMMAPGELYLDCVMYDLRTVFAEMEIKVADPGTVFSETVLEMSSLKCAAETPNRKNRLTMIAEPLEKGLTEDLESGRFDAGRLTETYGWDALAARSLWAFGADKERGANVLLNDTLPSEVDLRALKTVRESLCQGFQWAAKEGPLCDEPMRGVKFRLLDAVIAGESMARGSGQMIPTSRRVCYSAFLTATPRLMEPVYAVEIQVPAESIAVVYTLLTRRRGHVLQDVPKPGSTLYTVKALLPIMDSFGFEVDLRTQTQGQAFCQQIFDHWQLVPGDPLDASIPLRPLEPSPVQHLARDFMVKTRRRKGLGDDVVLAKYFDPAMMVKLAAQQQ